MKTTIDLPDLLVERVKLAASLKGTTIRCLVIQGLEMVLRAESDRSSATSSSALSRLNAGYALGCHPLSRNQIYDR